MKSLLIALFLLCLHPISHAQLPDNCKLKQGMNLGGLADWGTEIPFVNVMRNAREWYTKDVDNPNAEWNSNLVHNMTFRADGYPTHVPQTVDGSDFAQRVVTIWAITDGWMAGQYTVLWDGTGELSFWGNYENLTQTDPQRMTFDYNNPVGGLLEMTILSSDIDDPIHNIRVLMPGTEATYETQPFNPVWIDLVQNFPSVRFMDWGKTNNWGQGGGDWDDPSLFAWEDRAQLDDYTWANDKGVPYEMMIQLLNDYDLDGWVCMPHRASDDYLTQAATLFRDNLEAERKLTVEYSNEVWNWVFGQANWLYKYGCEQTGTDWPEGVVPYIQNCMDIWTTVFAGQTDRISRVAGVQLSWQDVSNRMVNNLTPGSIDAVAPAFYFGFTDENEAELDALGGAVTVADVAQRAREGMQQAKVFLQTQKAQLIDPLGLEYKFYEGGQHLTPHPFGVEPTYAQALLDVQRDTAMYNLYNEWFAFMRTLQEGDESLELMNFSLVGARSARYGSWGVLETMSQDVNTIPAPKFAAVLENQTATDCTQSDDNPPDPTPTVTEVRNFIFGHSLVDFGVDENVAPVDANRIPHWIHVIAEEAGYDYQATGQFGFLPQHANLPPAPNWGFTEMPEPVWDGDVEDFADADFNTILLTAGNFMQWQPADTPYPGEDGVISPLTATLDIMDWTTAQEDEMRIYIYENWPDMAPYLADQDNFNPTAAELTSYYDYTAVDFHDWWIDYQDMALAARAEIYPRMIPVGPIMADLFTQTPLSGIPTADLYVDNAPHGTPTAYFLAGLITYMGIYAEAAPDSYTVPASVHPLVATHYETTVDYIWNYLLNFNDDAGNSRVFFEQENTTALPVDYGNFFAEKTEGGVQLNWQTRTEYQNSHFQVQHSADGRNFTTLTEIKGQGSGDRPQGYAYLHTKPQVGTNYYRLQQFDVDGEFSYSPVRSVEITTVGGALTINPNPVAGGLLTISLEATESTEAVMQIFDLNGKMRHEFVRSILVGENIFTVDTGELSPGMYLLRVQCGRFVFSERFVTEK